MCIALHCECYGNNFCHWNLSHGTHSSISAIITFFFWIHLVTNFGSILCFALSTGAIIFTIMNIIGLIMGCKWGVDPPVKAPPDALTSRAAHPFPPSSELIQLQMEFTLLFLRVRVRGKVKKKNNKLKKNCLRCKCIPLTLSLKTTTPRKRKQITTHLLHKI